MSVTNWSARGCLKRRLLDGLLILGLATLGAAHAAEQELDVPEAHYVKFHPDFIVNLKGDRSHFLMVTVQGMSRQAAGITAAKHHMAGIRHHILMLLSEQTPDQLKSPKDMQRLMDETLVQVQDFLKSETGDPTIEAVYFTDFIVE